MTEYFFTVGKQNKYNIKYKNQVNFTKKKNIFIPILMNQILSIGTCLIPFIQHNDANRALMGSNMQKQAVPLQYKEVPIFSTGIEQIIVLNNDLNQQFGKSFIIKLSGLKKIISHEIINIDKKQLKFPIIKSVFIKKKVKLKIKNFKLLKYLKYKKRIFILNNNQITNQSNFHYLHYNLNENNWVRKNELFTENSSTKNQKFAIGKNLLVGYLPWKGYNFEDAILISDRLVKSNSFTSLHVKKYKTFLMKNETGEV